MKKEFYIKNMVCDRCKMVVQQIAERFLANAEEIQLGKVILNISPDFNQIEFDILNNPIYYNNNSNF